MTIQRREFLAGLAAAGAITLLPLAHAAGQQPTRHYSKPVIDAHVHWYSPEFIELIEKEGAANGRNKYSPERKGRIAVHHSRESPLSARGGTTFS